MESKDPNAPATAAELQNVKTELQSEVAGLKVEVKANTAAINRLALNQVQMQEDLRQTKEIVKDEAQRLRSEVTAQLETFAGRMETIWRESATLPTVVDEHGKRLREHEKRLIILESPH